MNVTWVVEAGTVSMRAVKASGFDDEVNVGGVQVLQEIVKLEWGEQEEQWYEQEARSDGILVQFRQWRCQW